MLHLLLRAYNEGCCSVTAFTTARLMTWCGRLCATPSKRANALALMGMLRVWWDVLVGLGDPFLMLVDHSQTGGLQKPQGAKRILPRSARACLNHIVEPRGRRVPKWAVPSSSKTWQFGGLARTPRMLAYTCPPFAPFIGRPCQAYNLKLGARPVLTQPLQVGPILSPCTDPV